jgi:pectate lyase-like protein
MSTYTWPPQSGGIFTYPTRSAFPATAANGTLALALDTDILYAYNSTSMTWIIIGGPGTALSIGTIDSVPPSSNGAVISADALIMQSASTTVPGLVNNTTQSFSGNKTFTGSVTANSLISTTSVTSLGGVFNAIPTTTTAFTLWQGLNAGNSLYVGSDNSTGSFLGQGDYTAFVWSATTKLVLASAGVVALTLDTSQNATFTGLILGNVSSASALSTGSSTSRTLAARFADSVNVKDFGATGNGSTDDTSAIQAAVTYAVANATGIFVPSGNYKLTSSISIAGPVSITGEGKGISTFLCVGTSAFVVSAAVSEVTISSLEIAQSVRYTTTPNSYVAINVQGTTGNNCNYHTYNDLLIDGFGTAFIAGAISSSTWRNCTVLYTHQGINATGQALNNYVSQCIFQEQNSITATSASGGFGIKVGDGSIDCEGFTITDTLIFGIQIGVWIDAAINVVVNNCVLDGIGQYGILSQSSAGAGTLNHIFTSNYIAIGSSSGIANIHLANAYAGTDAQNQGSIIRDNEILAYSFASVGYGILIDGAYEKRHLIAGNRVQNTTTADCEISSGTDYRVSQNLWKSTVGFSTTVGSGVSYINNTGNTNLSSNVLDSLDVVGDLTSLGTYSNTSANAGNVYIDSTGLLYRSTASVATGTVTSVSVVSANGLAGTVATPTTTPAITLSTTINSPVLAGNGTALIAATTTGTGSTVMLSASPTTTGTLTAAAINASGVVDITNTTASTSSTTGALIVAGGLGVGTGAFFGGNTDVVYSAPGANVSAIVQNTSSTANGTAQLLLRNDASDGLRLQMYSSTTTGAQLTNGVTGIQANIFTDFAGPMSLGTNDIAAINISTAQVVTLPSNIASTTSTTGTLVVTGGLGVSGAINAGSSVTASSAVTGLSSFKGTSSNSKAITATSNQAFVIGAASGFGLILIGNVTTGHSAIVFYSSSNVLNIMSQSATEFVLNSSPTSTETGLVLVSSTGTLIVYNGFSTTQTYQITTLGV